MLAVVLTVSAFGQTAKKYYKTGEEFFEAKKYADAITQYTNAINLDPKYKDAWYMRGYSYELTYEFSKAAEDFIRAIVFDPKNEELYYHLGKSYYELKKYSEALTAINHSLALSKKYMPSLQQKIHLLLATDAILPAKTVADSALEIDNSSANFYLKGVVLERGQSFKEAEDAYTNSIKKDKKNVDAYIALTLLQVTAFNKTEEAMKNINKAIELVPKSKQAFMARSKVYLKKLDYPLAINDISSAIVLDPNDETMFFLRANYYKQFNQQQNAINDLNKVIALNPKNADALYMRASSFEEIGSMPAAMKDYEALVAISEFDAKAHKLLKQAQDRIFELNREKDPPIIALSAPIAKNDTLLEIPYDKLKIALQGNVNDKSILKYVKVNDKDVTFEKKNGQNLFSTEISLDSSTVSFTVTSSDVYDNVRTNKYKIKRTEVNPPKVAIIAPVASDNGEVALDNSNGTLYVEGKANDESLIKSIMIDGVSASFKTDDMNPSFSANISIANKNKFTVTATDIYGNEKSYVYTLNRDNAALLNTNPMGKTWAVFIQNANYKTFASLEGPVKDVQKMREVFAKYQIHNTIVKTDLTKEQMEKFFSIELRDLVKSNQVNTVLVWYAGHGKFINETGYWIPVDAKRDDEFTYFNINVLRAALQSYPTTLVHTLVVTDACESGPSFYQAMRADAKEHTCDDWQATRMKSAQVFSSAGFELAKDNSQFTKTFAQVLATNPNACMDIQAVVTKVTSVVAQGNAQKPKFGKIAGLTDENGTFFFMAKQ
jgi:tetratricopeptide (TPR) repeat protein